MGRGYRRRDGCVVRPADSPHLNSRDFHASRDHKLTVPFRLFFSGVDGSRLPGGRPRRRCRAVVNSETQKWQISGKFRIYCI